jgi:hypothetical protein
MGRMSRNQLNLKWFSMSGWVYLQAINSRHQLRTMKTSLKYDDFEFISIARAV